MLVATSFTRVAIAQKSNSYFISGKFSNSKNQKFEDLLVHLLNSQGKKLIKTEVVEEGGTFRFVNIPSGNYYIITQSQTFSKYESDSIKINKDTDLGKIDLAIKSVDLKEVTVKAEKAFIEQKFDKTVINVSSSVIAEGNTALEVLEKAPGVSLDQNNNISMRGKQGVQIRIDGKIVPVQAADLATMLKSMSASQIEKINLITNPSAKYEASGSAGIIDIILKKGKNNGTNLNLSMRYGQGVYGKLNPSVNFNSKSKNINFFGAYGFNGRKDYGKLDIERLFYSGSNDLTGGIDYDNLFTSKMRMHGLRLGADFDLSKQITIGFLTNGSFNNTSEVNSSKAKSANPLGLNTGRFITNGDNEVIRNNGSVNLNYKHKIDTLGQELTADFDYAKFNSSDLQNYNTEYFNPDNSVAKIPYVLFGDLDGLLSIRSARLDYVLPLKSLGLNIEAGAKTSLVKSDNDVSYYDRSNGNSIFDSGKSNHFLYSENINALYLNGTKNWKKLSLQVGLRWEATDSKGQQVFNNEQLDREYSQLFPSGYIGYTINDSHQTSISASRRINRPSYRQLNPFKEFLDPLTYGVGNPNLNPEIESVFELTHTFKQKYIAKLGFSRKKDNILMTLSPDVEPNSVIQTTRNLGRFDYYNLSLSAPLKVGKWLNSAVNFLTYYSKYSGFIVNTVVNESKVTYNLNVSNSITLGPNTVAELSGNYQSKLIQGLLVQDPVWFVNMGIQQQLWNKKASLRLNVTDVFFTNMAHVNTRLTGYGEVFNQSRDSRVSTLSFSYSIGVKSAPARRRSEGADEEKRRAG